MENKAFILKNQAGEIICQKALVASGVLDRMKGLMFTEKLFNCDGLLIVPCNSIHTFFMLYALDVLFLDKNYNVVKVIYNIMPWRLTWIYLKAHQVLEMKAGTMKKNIMKGERLEVVCIN